MRGVFWSSLLLKLWGNVCRSWWMVFGFGAIAPIIDLNDIKLIFTDLHLECGNFRSVYIAKQMQNEIKNAWLLYFNYSNGPTKATTIWHILGHWRIYVMLLILRAFEEVINNSNRLKLNSNLDRFSVNDVRYIFCWNFSNRNHKNVCSGRIVPLKRIQLRTRHGILTFFFPIIDMPSMVVMPERNAIGCRQCETASSTHKSLKLMATMNSRSLLHTRTRQTPTPSHTHTHTHK